MRKRRDRMASYKTIKKGSNGSSVSDLQKLLNSKGYDLSIDGVFGEKTQAAVRDYQKNNNLSVDGIVGNNTWSSLYGTSGAANAANAAANAANPNGPVTASKKSTAEYLANYEGARPTYTESEAVKNAAKMLADYEAKKPAEYTGKYEAQIDSLLDQILNRDKFSYDFNADPIYQQYADNYKRQGQMAMMDTMGNAAALTGGYGNSYAQTAGQQAYQGYLSQLNNVIPELQNVAYQRYRDEGTDLYNNLGVLQGMDESDYGRYRDSVSDYYNDLGYYYGKYGDLSDREYNQYLNDLNAWQNDRAYWYTKQQDELAQQNWEREFALAQAKAARSGGGGSSSEKISEKYDDILSKVRNSTFIDAMAILDEAEGKEWITSAERQEIEYLRNNMGRSDIKEVLSSDNETITSMLSKKK